MKETENVFDIKNTILIIDDDPLRLEALDMSLKRGGFETVTADGGKKALQIIKDQLPAVIICDQTMPDITGNELFKKAADICPDSIRILITGDPKMETALEAINVGACASVPSQAVG